MTPVLLPGTDTAESTSAFLESIGSRAIGIPPGAVKWEPESEELAWKYDAWGFSLTDSGKAAVASLSPNTPVLLGIPPDPDSAALLYGTAIAAGLPIAGIIPIASLAPRDLKKWLGSPLPLEDVRSLVTAGLCRLALAYAFASIISIHWSRVSWYRGTLPGIVSLKPLSMLILSGISKSKWRRANHPDGRRWKMYSTVGHHRYYIRYDVIPDNDPAHVDEAGRIKDPDYAAELWRNSGGFGHGRNSEEKLSLKPPTLLSFSDLVVSFSKKDPTVLHELMPSLRRLWIQGLITWPFNDSKKVPDWAWDRKEEICSGMAGVIPFIPFRYAGEHAVRRPDIEVETNPFAPQVSIPTGVAVEEGIKKFDYDVYFAIGTRFAASLLPDKELIRHWMHVDLNHATLAAFKDEVTSEGWSPIFPEEPLPDPKYGTRFPDKSPLPDYSKVNTVVVKRSRAPYQWDVEFNNYFTKIDLLKSFSSSFGNPAIGLPTDRIDALFELETRRVFTKQKLNPNLTERGQGYMALLPPGLSDTETAALFTEDIRDRAAGKGDFAGFLELLRGFTESVMPDIEDELRAELTVPSNG